LGGGGRGGGPRGATQDLRGSPGWVRCRPGTPGTGEKLLVFRAGRWVSPPGFAGRGGAGTPSSRLVRVGFFFGGGKTFGFGGARGLGPGNGAGAGGARRRRNGQVKGSRKGGDTGQKQKTAGNRKLGGRGNGPTGTWAGEEGRGGPPHRVWGGGGGGGVGGGGEGARGRNRGVPMERI